MEVPYYHKWMPGQPLCAEASIEAVCASSMADTSHFFAKETFGKMYKWYDVSGY